MNTSILAPIPLLEAYCTLTTYHICYAKWILESEPYRAFFLERKTRGHSVILDGPIQSPREAYSVGNLLEAAEILKPDLVVAPDWELNGGRTSDRILEFCSLYKSRLSSLNIGILGMLHGASPEIALTCLSRIQKSVVAIGLPRSLETVISRADFLRQIPKEFPIHIFGIHSSPSDEIDNLLRPEEEGYNIVGISTDLPVRLGFQCRLLDEYRPEPSQLDWESSSDPYPEFTLDNVEDLILQARGEV